MVRMPTVLAALLLGAVGCARSADPEAPSPPPRTSAWAAIVDADARGAIVLDDDQGYRGIRRDGSTAWRRPAGAPVPVRGGGACVAGDDRALLLGQPPAILHRDGRQEPITDLEDAGTCDLAASGGIVAELAQHRDGLRARVRAVDARGSVL
jgi:hypothetical protein